MIKFIKRLRNKIWFISEDIAQQRRYITQLTGEFTQEHLRKSPRYQDPKRLLSAGYKFYSQTDEDGIIGEIFRRIGLKSRIFIEFGIGNGLENNTAALLFDGWKGLWIEGNKDAVALLQSRLPKLTGRKRLSVKHAFITAENINELISTAGFAGEIDLMSVDIDGNDIHVFEKITCVQPRVVVIEYNSKFPPHVRFTVPYSSEQSWNSSDFMGASLGYICDRMDPLGYRLVSCNMSGTNAFFIKEEELKDLFCPPYTAENHYEPERYFLANIGHAGHPPDYRTLDEAAGA